MGRNPFPGILKPSQLNLSSGRLTPGNYVGTLSLEIFNESEPSSSPFLLEVRSKKTSYREDYRYMLKYITQTCTDLLMRHTSPVTQTFTVDFFKNSETQGIYVLSLVKNPAMEDEWILLSEQPN